MTGDSILNDNKRDIPQRLRLFLVFFSKLFHQPSIHRAPLAKHVILFSFMKTTGMTRVIIQSAFHSSDTSRRATNTNKDDRITCKLSILGVTAATFIKTQGWEKYQILVVWNHVTPSKAAILLKVTIDLMYIYRRTYRPQKEDVNHTLLVLNVLSRSLTFSPGISASVCIFWLWGYWKLELIASDMASVQQDIRLSCFHM